jgi:hypothetical protein
MSKIEKPFIHIAGNSAIRLLDRRLRSRGRWPGARPAALSILVAAAIAGPAPSALAQSAAELRSQIEVLQRKVDELERKQQTADEESRRKLSEIEKRPAASAPANAVTGGDLPGSFKLPGTNTSIRIGGYVKADVVYSSPQTGVNSQADLLLVPSSIPIGAAADAASDGLKLGARETRINILTSTPTSWGPLTTFIEADFYGADGNEVVSNSNNLRLRHAFGTLGSFGAGQFWSNAMVLQAIPETLDFGGPVGQLFVRQTQIRWTQKFGGGQWAVSLENPEATFASTTSSATTRPDRDKYPDIVGRVDFDVGKAKLSLGALVRNVRSDRPGNAIDNKWGAAVIAGGRVPTIGEDDFRFEVYAGNVIGRYQAGFYVDGVLNANGQLLSLPDVVGGFGAYRHFWAPGLRSSLVLSASRADLPGGTFGTNNQKDYSVHANLIWTPWKNVDVGIEYIWARREIENGQDGDLNRVQASAKYSF